MRKLDVFIFFVNSLATKFFSEIKNSSCDSVAWNQRSQFCLRKSMGVFKWSNSDHFVTANALPPRTGEKKFRKNSPNQTKDLGLNKWKIFPVSSLAISQSSLLLGLSWNRIESLSIVIYNKFCKNYLRFSSFFWISTLPRGLFKSSYKFKNDLVIINQRIILPHSNLFRANLGLYFLFFRRSRYINLRQVSLVARREIACAPKIAFTSLFGLLIL